MRVVMVALAFAAGMVCASSAGAATLTPGFVAGTIVGDTVATRYRGPSTGREIYAGKNDLGVSTNRAETEFAWSNGATPFLFTFDGLTGEVFSQVGGAAGKSATYASGFTMEAFVLKLALNNQSRKSGHLQIKNLTVNGEAVGDLASKGYAEWTVTGFKVSPLLTVGGTFVRGGTFDANDSERVRFEIGAGLREMPTAVPVPAALPLLVAGLGALVLASRRRKAA